MASIKRRSLIINSLLFLLIVISLPIVYAAFTGAIVKNFKVELVISNRNPTIQLINATGFSVDPIDGSSAVVLISFNVTDADGVQQSGE